jgi:hypothetical protein
MRRPSLYRAKFNNYIKTNASNSTSRRHLIAVSISNLQSFVGGLWLGLDVTLASEARITHHFFFKKLASQTSFGPWIIWFMLDLALPSIQYQLSVIKRRNRLIFFYIPHFPSTFEGSDLYFEWTKRVFVVTGCLAIFPHYSYYIIVGFPQSLVVSEHFRVCVT